PWRFLRTVGGSPPVAITGPSRPTTAGSAGTSTISSQLLGSGSRTFVTRMVESARVLVENRALGDKRAGDRPGHLVDEGARGVRWRRGARRGQCSGAPAGGSPGRSRARA